MIEQKYRTILFAITLCVLAAVCFIAGFFAGTSIIIPENIEIDFDRENKLETFSKSMDGLTENFGNNTCNYNVTIDQEMLKDLIKSDLKEKVKVIDTYCKRPASIGRLHLEEPRELKIMELNEPVYIQNRTLEIIGANDYLLNIVIDINGARHTFNEGDCYSDGKIKFCAEKVFVTTIPLLDAVAQIEIIKEND